MSTLRTPLSPIPEGSQIEQIVDEFKRLIKEAADDPNRRGNDDGIVREFLDSVKVTGNTISYTFTFTNNENNDLIPYPVNMKINIDSTNETDIRAKVVYMFSGILRCKRNEACHRRLKIALDRGV